MNKNRFKILAGMVLAAAAVRLLPHPPNFTPIAALALFGGASFDSKPAAFLVPLGALFLSDLVTGFYATMPIVYGSFVLITCLGFWVRRRHNLTRLALATIGGALLFFVVTNLGFWLFEAYYPQTFAGFVECYVAAIPFFRNTLLSDIFYSALLFGGLAFAEMRWPTLARTALSSA